MSTQILRVSKNGSALNVEWNDGEKSNFNFMWLRDNCRTAHDKDSRHRMFKILEVSTNIKTKTCKKRTALYSRWTFIWWVKYAAVRSHKSQRCDRIGTH